MPGDNFSAYDARHNKTFCGRLWAPKSRKYVIVAVGAIFVLIIIIALASGGPKTGFHILFQTFQCLLAGPPGMAPLRYFNVTYGLIDKKYKWNSTYSNASDPETKKLEV